MRCFCERCRQWFRQPRNCEGPQFCPTCHGLFFAPPERKVPPWIMGVLVVLAVNCQLMAQHREAAAAAAAAREISPVAAPASQSRVIAPAAPL